VTAHQGFSNTPKCFPRKNGRIVLESYRPVGRFFDSVNTSSTKGDAVEASRQVLSINVEEARWVSGLLESSPAASACYVLGHGAGAGMTHPFLECVAQELDQRSIATLRYQFPYMEQRSKRPDSPKLAQATVRAAVVEALRLVPDLPLFAGGKSFGGRMTSQAQAASLLPGVRGLIFLGFPLHPPGRPSTERAAHLFDVEIPMLFLQGTRDEFADLELLQPLVKQLGARATLKLFQDADHSFHVPARTGRTDGQVRAEVLNAMTDWIRQVILATSSGGAEGVKG
jgi:predicted alpha/beta-hydrolase family hydrolase